MIYWNLVPSLPEYMASSDGQVMRVPFRTTGGKGRNRGYGGNPTWGVRRGCGRRFLVFRGKNYRVHRLICEAFYGPPPFPGAVVMHLNDDPNDNRIENLKWATQKENLNTPAYREYIRNRRRKAA